MGLLSVMALVSVISFVAAAPSVVVISFVLVVLVVSVMLSLAAGLAVSGVAVGSAAFVAAGFVASGLVVDAGPVLLQAAKAKRATKQKVTNNVTVFAGVWVERALAIRRNAPCLNLGDWI